MGVAEVFFLSCRLIRGIGRQSSYTPSRTSSNIEAFHACAEPLVQLYLNAEPTRSPLEIMQGNKRLVGQNLSAAELEADLYTVQCTCSRFWEERPFSNQCA